MNNEQRQPLAGRTLLFLPRYTDTGPSSRLRMSQFIPAFEAAGARVTVSPFFTEAYLRGYFASGAKSKAQTLIGYAHRLSAVLTQRADLVWIEKEVFPYLPGGAERLIRRGGRPYVVDYDDAIFHNYDLSGSGLVRRVLGAKLDPLLAGAALVTPGNQYLEDYVRAHGARDVLRTPTVVDPRRYPVAPPPGDGKVRIGWIGTPANAKYLAPVIAAMERLAERLPLVLMTVGAEPIAGIKVPQEVHPWTEESEGALAGRMDIGVMPLTDSPWERGKCGYKLIQYMAAGRPVIASPVGVNSAIVTPDIGLLAQDIDQWAAAIEALAGDAARRAAMGAAARRRVEDEYSVDAVAPRLIEAFSRLTGGVR